MSIHHLARVTVLKLEERHRTIAGPNRAVEMESMGWWALLDTDPKIWIFLGAFKPEGAFTITIEAKWSPA